jgi:hypothetical protein
MFTVEWTSVEIRGGKFDVNSIFLERTRARIRGTRPAMRSSAFTLCMLLSACAVGGNGADDTTPIDSGGVKDSSPPKDATTLDTGPVQDSGPTQDSSPVDVVTTPDTSTGPCAFTGVLATWDFTGELGSQVSTAAKSSATNVTAGAVSRASVLTPVAGADSLNSSNWATATTVNTAKYVTFSITPKGSCSIDVTQVSIATKSSATGPTKVALATSDDAFATMVALAPNTTATPSLAITGATTALEFRVYGWAASAAGGTMRVDLTLTVSGSTQ